MKAKRARIEEAQNVQAEIKRVNINIEEVKSLASSSRAVLAGHEGRINTLLASKASLEQAKAAAPQSPEITETLALYDKELTWSRQQVESLKTIIDGYERELVSLTQTVETLTSKKKSLETEQ